MIQIVDFIGFSLCEILETALMPQKAGHRGHLGATKVVVTTWGYLSDVCVVIDPKCFKIQHRRVVVLFTYIWFIFMVNVGKYTIHGSYGYCISSPNALYISAQYVCVVRVRPPFQSHGAVALPTFGV